jgi:hypothetical protein
LAGNGTPEFLHVGVIGNTISRREASYRPDGDATRSPRNHRIGEAAMRKPPKTAFGSRYPVYASNDERTVLILACAMMARSRQSQRRRCRGRIFLLTESFEGESSMSNSFDFKHSPRDEATFRKWRRGMVMFYGGIGLAVTATVIAAHFVNVAIHVATR